ncbi:PQQ-binding-like beta-propeller repeat protein [Flavobacterium sp. WW92]|uniref:PQQ-binding-like beta-propeller repeat protein n=1 Tax=unclassified Flavobacterium TaxID=196869 RepID=UPI002223F795|nr:MULTISPECIES: PQQ-binding-like beta-propeller repeat protein [unclassified Flavobacterium]WDO12245.1 PQQ-binding-like beta-propeller repeat protein [Flavobacterium sp. WW92]
MLKASFLSYSLPYVLLLASTAAFSQTEIYKSNSVFKNFEATSLSASLVIAADKVLFNAADYKIYAIDKTSLQPVWEIYTGWKSNTPPYLHDAAFFYGNYEKGRTRVAQYDLNTGAKRKELPFESLQSEPYIANGRMYCTVLWDGGKLVAYDLQEDKTLWQKNIGHGAEVAPAYRPDRIIANAEDDNWFETDYSGNLLKGKARKHAYIDTVEVFVKEYKFLTHDGKEITPDFLRKNKIDPLEHQVKRTQSHTFILSEKQLLVLGTNKRKAGSLALETIVEEPYFDPDDAGAILTTNAESVWLYCQKQLIHYDFKNSKLLRKLDLTSWNPHQVRVDGRTIWLISKNDGQLYGLDFEPDQQTADRLRVQAERQWEINNPKPVDPKKIEAAKAAQEKLKNKKNRK